MTRILLVDDHELVRDGFASILEGISEFKVIGSLENGQQVMPFLKQLKEMPHIVLMDIDMPVLNGIEATKRIKAAFPEIKVLILTMHDTNASHNMAAAAQADGFLLKNVRAENLKQVIQSILDGGKHFPTKTKRSNQDLLESREEVELTLREKEVLKHIANGLSNKEIAEELNISHRTVDTHRTHLKSKLNVNGIAGLVRYAFETGLIY